MIFECFGMIRFLFICKYSNCMYWYLILVVNMVKVGKYLFGKVFIFIILYFDMYEYLFFMAIGSEDFS